MVEDAAHAIEAKYKDRKIGTIGDLTCFSFYVTKNLTTGEGGMVLTDNDDFAEKIRVLSLHGLSKDAYRRFSDAGYKHYQVLAAGFKYNMMDLQAATGMHQLDRIENSYNRRDEIWSYYQKTLKSLPLGLPPPDEPNIRHARHLYTVRVDPSQAGRTRDEVVDELFKENIGAGVHYTALHLHPYYRQMLGYKEGDYPYAEWIGARTLFLPLSAKLTDEDENDVVAALTRILS